VAGRAEAPATLSVADDISGRLERRLDRIEQRLDRYESRLDRLETNVERLLESAATLLDRLERIQKILD